MSLTWVEEAANETLKVVEEIGDVEAALENLWMTLGGIAVSEEHRRLRSQDEE